VEIQKRFLEVASYFLFFFLFHMEDNNKGKEKARKGPPDSPNVFSTGNLPTHLAQKGQISPRSLNFSSPMCYKTPEINRK